MGIDSGVGSPGILLLNAWGTLVFDALGERPYLVGSACESTSYRDVDVRVMISKVQWESLIGDLAEHGYTNPRWSALCMAFSSWGQSFTGLPIDFQIQHILRANA